MHQASRCLICRTTRPTTTPVFILTLHPRDPVEMAGGTTFHFVTDGIESAPEQARKAAGGKDVQCSSPQAPSWTGPKFKSRPANFRDPIG